jgi:tetratricopeptide (TPR) repeat protein
LNIVHPITNSKQAKEMKTNTPSPNADELISQGLAASQAGNSPEAIDLWQRASAAAPSSGIPHFLMASEFASLGEVDRAEASFANAVLLAPGLLTARYQLGLLQFSSGRAAMALVTWEPLLADGHSDPIAPALACFVRGYAALAHDAFDDALASFEAGLQINTTNLPLSGDIRMVVDRIHALRAGQPTPNTNQESNSEADVKTEPEVQDASSDSHVLLSNYVSKDKPH